MLFTQKSGALLDIKIPILSDKAMSKELLQKVRVVDPVSGTDQVADVLVVDGTLEAIAPEISTLPKETQVRNCQGLILGPGLVDLYSHSGEPGFEERETISSLMQAAAAGGFTRVVLLPETKPPVDTPAGLSFLQRQTLAICQKWPNAHCCAPPQLYFWGALTLGVQGKQMTELAELAASQVVGFSDGQPLSDLGLLRRLLEYIQPLEKPISLWPCDRQLASSGVMREGTESIRFGLSGQPAIAETTALAGLLEIVAVTHTPVHLMRISTRRSVELIQAAKAQGVPIQASTTWMHLLLDSRDIGRYDPNLRLEPPLGNPDDRQALVEAVQLGIIDAIAIDHSPYTYEEKTVAFAEAPPGAIGLELALPLLWQQLVSTGQWSALQLWRALSTQPAECLQQKPAAIAAGQIAEMTLFDPNQEWDLTPANLYTGAFNTPWAGKPIKGRVRQTWSRFQ